jgi:NADH:ubiquinone oxidoreductase subunit F (NADH-binding)
MSAVSVERRALRLLEPAGRHGVPPLGSELIDAVEAAGLTGRGGAGFPTATKLRAVAERPRPIVVANGTEGEPTSRKDKVLTATNPHLVLDGAIAAADAVGSDEIVVAVGTHARASRASLERAIRERRERVRIQLEPVPDRFVAGEETALVRFLDGGPAKPTVAPPRPFERGLRGRPTLVQNVETLAAIGLIAHDGPERFRQVQPVLVTIGGAVRRPGVTEVPLGTPVRAILRAAVDPTAIPQAVLVGGYFGRWVRWPEAAAAELSPESLGPLGARTLLVFPADACGVCQTARLARYLAGESAEQCGPCLFGLAAVADTLESLARCEPRAGDAVERLHRLGEQIARRGACSHPDGAIRMVASALAAFADEVEAHLRGRCTATNRQPLFPTEVTR